jgi:hypothetical protein
MRSGTSRRRLVRLYALGLGWIVLLAVSLALLTPAFMDIYFVLGVDSLALQFATTMGIALALATTAMALTAWVTRGPSVAASPSVIGATVDANA